MNKKTICIISIVASLAIICSIVVALKLKKDKYPKIVYIKGDTYYGTNKKCDIIPRKMPDGVIDTFIENEIMPDMMDSANFGKEYEKLEYMFLEDGQLIVKMGEDWYYFKNN